jgi:WD40 repeat protein
MHARFIALTALLLSLVTGFGISVAQENIVSIAIPAPAINYVVSPDGMSAAVYPNAMIVRDQPPGENSYVQIFDLATGAVTQSFTELPDWVSEAAYLPGGRLLTALVNGDFILWDLATGEIQRQWWTALYMSRIDVSPDGSRVYVLVLSTPSTIFEMDLATGALLRPLSRHPATMFDVMSAPGDMERMGDYQFVDLAASPDGKSLAYANSDGEIVIADLASESFSVARPPSETPLMFSARSLRFAPDSATLFYMQWERDARHVMRVEPNSAVIAMYGENVVTYAVSSDATKVAWVERTGETSRILMQDVTGGAAEVVYDLTEAGLAVSPIPTLSFAAGGSRLLLDVNPADDEEQSILLVVPVG